MNTVILSAVAAFLVAAGLFLIRVDRRDRTPPTIPLPVIDPGGQFQEPRKRLPRADCSGP